MPDPDDPNAHLVTIWGGAIDAAENGERELYNLLRVELAAVVDSATPGVWKIVSTVIDPKRVRSSAHNFKPAHVGCMCVLNLTNIVII